MSILGLGPDTLLFFNRLDDLWKLSVWQGREQIFSRGPHDENLPANVLLDTGSVRVDLASVAWPIDFPVLHGNDRPR